MDRTLDKIEVINQPTRCVRVDFSDSSDYSVSASDTTGYFDVWDELRVEYAFVHTETGGKLDVVFYEDDNEELFPFQSGTDLGKVKRIYYHVENTISEFWLRY